MEALTYDISQVRVLRLRGSLDETGTVSFVRQAYREILRHPGHLILNGEALDGLCGTGLAMRDSPVRKLGRAGTRLAVVPPKDPAVDWAMLASENWVELYGSEFSAVQGLTKRRGTNMLLRGTPERGPRS